MFRSAARVVRCGSCWWPWKRRGRSPHVLRVELGAADDGPRLDLAVQLRADQCLPATQEGPGLVEEALVVVTRIDRVGASLGNDHRDDVVVPVRGGQRVDLPAEPDGHGGALGVLVYVQRPQP